MKTAFLILSLIFSLTVSVTSNAKTFQNSYLSFEVPDTWACLQEGVAWTCTSQDVIEAKEAVIVLAAKVAGPEDTMNNFMNHLKDPKKISTKVGTPMPSQVMYAQERDLGGQKWVQAQHLGSEILDYYTLYLATKKEKLAILVSFSAERTKYQKYNPIFDGAVRSLKIIAGQQLLFPKTESTGGSGVIGIEVPGQGASPDALLEAPSTPKSSFKLSYLLILIGVLAVAVGLWMKSRKPGKNKVAKRK